MWIDSHCHLNDERFEGDLDKVLKSAAGANVETVLTICTELKEAPDLVKLAANYPQLYCSVGVHPHEAQNPENLVDLAEKLEHFASFPKVIGLGETGLDYYYEHSPRDIQRDAFATHIEIAKHTKLPLIVHTRDAEAETVALLKRESGNVTGVIHCFSGTQDLASQSLDLGLYISLSGIVTFNKAHELREIVKTLPLDRILLETDAPYLAPVPFRGKRNEPAFMVHTAQVVADLLEVSLETLAQATSDNFYALFTKAEI